MKNLRRVVIVVAIIVAIAMLVVATHEILIFKQVKEQEAKTELWAAKLEKSFDAWLVNANYFEFFLDEEKDREEIRTLNNELLYSAQRAEFNKMVTCLNMSFEKISEYYPELLKKVKGHEKELLMQNYKMLNNLSATIASDAKIYNWQIDDLTEFRERRILPYNLERVKSFEKVRNALLVEEYIN